MRDIESIRAYCLEKKAVEESFPFDETTLVFKVAGKMFALIGLDNEPKFINLKCDPEKALDLRDRHDQIKPGYHMSKKHWNSVYFEDGLDDALVTELIDHSYNLVLSKLPKKTKIEWGL